MKYYREIIIILLLALLLSAIAKCEQQTHYANDNLEALSDKTIWYNNRLGIETASHKTLQLTNAEMHRILIQKNDTIAQLTKEFVKLRSVVTYKSTAKLPLIGIKIEKPLSLESSDSSLVNFQRLGEVSEKWFRFDYNLTCDSLKLANFTIPNNTIAITGVKRKWFLGKSIVTTDIIHSNPYIQTENIAAAEIIVPEPWYKKWYLWLAAGIAGGLLIN